MDTIGYVGHIFFVINEKKRIYMKVVKAMIFKEKAGYKLKIKINK